MPPASSLLTIKVTVDIREPYPWCGMLSTIFLLTRRRGSWHGGLSCGLIRQSSLVGQAPRVRLSRKTAAPGCLAGDHPLSFTIDHGVHVPPKRSTRNRLAIIPWSTMGVGDSVFFRIAFLYVRSRNWISNQVHQANKRYTDRGFIGRKVDGGARIWRVR